MIKLLPIALVVIIILGISGYLIYRSNSSTATPSSVTNALVPLPSAPALTTLQTQTKQSGQTSEERIRLLEQSILELKAQLDTVNATKTTPVSSNNDADITNLQNQINQLKTTSQTVSQSTGKSTLYVPLGNSGSSNSLTWATVNDIQIALNPSMFPGYTSMQLEVMVQVYQGNGTASVQLYDLDDGIAMQGSQVSTTSQTYTLVSSNTFTLPAGTKNYRLQLMTSTGYTASISMARLRVNF